MVTTHGNKIIRTPRMQKVEYRNEANTPLYWTDGRTTKYTERLNWCTVWLTSGSRFNYISKIDISHDARYRQRLRYESTVYMRSVDSNKQAVPWCQRPGYKSSANALVSLQRAQGKGVHQIPMHLRTRQNNTLDPAVQQHLEWLSFNWKTYFSSSSSPTWTESPNAVEFFILGPSMARMPLSRVARQRMVGSATTTTTPESRTDWYKETCTGTSERKGLSCCQVHLNPDFICSLVHFSDFSSFWQFRVQTEATAMNATGKCTDNTSPNAHTRTFSHACTLDVITRFAHSSLVMSFVECSFHSVSSYVLITYCH